MNDYFHEDKSLQLKIKFAHFKKYITVNVDLLYLSCSFSLSHSQYTHVVSLCLSLGYTHTAYLSVAQSLASASPLIVWEQNNSPGFGNGLPLILIRETLNKIYPQILQYMYTLTHCVCVGVCKRIGGGGQC